MTDILTTRSEYIKTDGGSLVFYPDKGKMIRRLNLHTLFVLVPISGGVFVLCGYAKRFLVSTLQHSPYPNPMQGLTSTVLTLLTYLPGCVLVLYFVLYVTMRGVVRRQNKPLLTLSAEGVTITATGAQLGLLYWDEIGEVRTFTFIQRFVGIVPRDKAALYRRLGRRSISLRLTAWCIPLYRLLGLFIAPISLSQDCLPLSADEIVTLIRDRRPLDPALPVPAGVWPPAPQGLR